MLTLKECQSSFFLSSFLSGAFQYNQDEHLLGELVVDPFKSINPDYIFILFKDVVRERVLSLGKVYKLYI